MAECSDNILLWLDESKSRPDQTMSQEIDQLHKIISEIYVFPAADPCVDFLTDLDQEHVFLIISVAFAQQIIAYIHAIACLDYIYVITSDADQTEQFLIQPWSKVVGVYSDIPSICKSLLALKQFDRDSIPMSFISPFDDALEDVTSINPDRIEPTFMYTQLFKEVLLTMHFDTQSREHFANFCRERIPLSPNVERLVEEFRREYSGSRAIWWYTRESFAYQLLNKALRLLEPDVILTMGFFVTDLHRQIEQLHKEQIHLYHDQLFTVYRGQRLSKADFNRLDKSLGGLISFNNFLSTSRNQDMPKIYATSAANGTDVYGILFEIEVDPTVKSAIFAGIRDQSYFPDEDEILFSMHTIFRINKVLKLPDAERLFQVHLVLTMEKDQQLWALTASMQLHSESSTYAQKVANLLVSIDRTDLIPKLFQNSQTAPTDLHHAFLNQYYYAFMQFRQGNLQRALTLLDKMEGNSNHSFCEHDSYRARIHNLMASVYQALNQPSQALSFHEKALTTMKRSLRSNHPHLAASYNNIGSVYDSMGEYSKALPYYETALEIRKKSLPRNHPDLAVSYNNIGFVYEAIGEYSKALSFYQKALDINKKSLPPNHPQLAISYNNIGLVYQKVGACCQALRFVTKGLDINKESLPPNHPQLATSYNNIGLVYDTMGEYSQALPHYVKALDIRKKSLSPDHPDLATSYNNVGLLYHSRGVYPQALLFLKQAVEMRKKSLRSNHPDLATSHNNIGLVYESMGEYSQALSSFEKALNIRKTCLPSNHPYLAQSYKNIGLVYESVGEQSQALPYYEKALDINEKNLPPNHPDLGISYNSIGLIYHSMGNYHQALRFLEKALEINKKSLPPNHPDLASCYKNLGALKYQRGDFAEALRLFEEAQKIFETFVSPVHPDVHELTMFIQIVHQSLRRH